AAHAVELADVVLAGQQRQAGDDQDGERDDSKRRPGDVHHDLSLSVPPGRFPGLGPIVCRATHGNPGSISPFPGFPDQGPKPAVPGPGSLSQSTSRRPKARLATDVVPMKANSATATADGMVVVPFPGLEKIMSPP